MNKSKSLPKLNFIKKEFNNDNITKIRMQINDAIFITWKSLILQNLKKKLLNLKFYKK